jgi:SAM-dependent methyltransferase
VAAAAAPCRQQLGQLGAERSSSSSAMARALRELLDSAAGTAAALTSHARQRRIYSALLAEHGGSSHRALHWNSKRGQRLRLDVLLQQLGPLTGRSVLDLGSGCGGLASHFEENVDPSQCPAELVGYDIVPEMVEYCQQSFPWAQFECRDVLLHPPRREFDFVVASGIFAFGNERFFRDMTRASAKLARSAFAFNLYEDPLNLSTAFWKSPRENIVHHLATLQLAPPSSEQKRDQPISNRDATVSEAARCDHVQISVRGDYLPGDVTFVLRPAAEINNQKE